VEKEMAIGRRSSQNLLKAGLQFSVGRVGRFMKKSCSS